MIGFLQKTKKIDDDLKAAELGLNSEQDNRKELEARVEGAIMEDFPANKKNQLVQLVLKHVSVLKIKLENDGSARIAPMEVK